jgi:hypothetical protein
MLVLIEESCEHEGKFEIYGRTDDEKRGFYSFFTDNIVFHPKRYIVKIEKEGIIQEKMMLIFEEKITIEKKEKNNDQKRIDQKRIDIYLEPQQEIKLRVNGLKIEIKKIYE